jgi:hypothetical protein
MKHTPHQILGRKTSAFETCGRYPRSLDLRLRETGVYSGHTHLDFLSFGPSGSWVMGAHGMVFWSGIPAKLRDVLQDADSHGRRVRVRIQHITAWVDKA